MSTKGFTVLQITDLGNMFEWLNSIIIPNIFPELSYDGSTLSPQDQTFVNGYGLRLGPVFLRQKRANDGMMHFIFVLYSTWITWIQLDFIIVSYSTI